LVEDFSNSGLTCIPIHLAHFLLPFTANHCNDDEIVEMKKFAGMATKKLTFYARWNKTEGMRCPIPCYRDSFEFQSSRLSITGN
jgi:hypothetical protein